MKPPILDLEDGDLLLPLSDDISIDSNCNLMLQLSENAALDMDSGEMHWTVPLENDSGS